MRKFTEGNQRGLFDGFYYPRICLFWNLSHSLKRYIKKILLERRHEKPLFKDLLWRAFSDLFASDALLWNQFKFAFNIFTCRILITSCKNIIITVISNEAANELTINAKLYWKVTIFPRQELAPLFQLQQKVGSCLIAGGSYINIVCLHIVVFNKRDILHL